MHYSVALLFALAAGRAFAAPQFPAKGTPKGKGSAGAPASAPQAEGCSPLELVIARATTEKIGYGIVGAPLLKAVQDLVPGTTGYAVNYPANWDSGSPAIGVADIVRYFSTKPQQCPEQRYVLSGYSQGGTVVHQGAVKLDKSILRDKIIATATFGDPGQQATKAKAGASPGGNAPMWPEELEGKIKFNCNKGDPTCTPGGSNIMAHVNYLSGTFVQDSAKFIQ